jgi:hypothetical protein
MPSSLMALYRGGGSGGKKGTRSGGNAGRTECSRSSSEDRRGRP